MKSVFALLAAAVISITAVFFSLDDRRWPSQCLRLMAEAQNDRAWSVYLCASFTDKESLYTYLRGLAASQGRPDDYYLP